MEKHRQYTIIMTSSGLIYKAKPVRDAGIGTEVSYELAEANKRCLFFFYPNKKAKNSFRVIAMVCLLLIFTLPFYFISSSSKTYAYVNVDINPSVELEIDDQLHVQSMKALNEDATQLIDTMADYKNKPLEDILSIMMDKSEQSGLMKHGKNVVVGVSYANEKDVSVLDTLDSYFNGEETDWQMASFVVPKEIRKTAKKEDKSMNELMAKDLDKQDTAGQSDENKKLKDDEKAIIHSFYDHHQSEQSETKATSEEKGNEKGDQRDVTGDGNKGNTIPPSHKEKQEEHKEKLKNNHSKNSETHKKPNQHHESKKKHEEGRNHHAHKDKQHIDQRHKDKREDNGHNEKHRPHNEHKHQHHHNKDAHHDNGHHHKYKQHHE